MFGFSQCVAVEGTLLAWGMLSFERRQLAAYVATPAWGGRLYRRVREQRHTCEAGAEKR
jgi:hypothetical protein